MGTPAKLVRLVGQAGGSEKQQTTLMNAELLSNVAGPVHGIIWSLKCRWHNKVMGNALMDADFPNFLNPTIQSQVVPWDCPLGLHTLCKTSSMCTGQCCMLDWRCAETQQHIDTHLIGARLVRALIRKNLEPKIEDLSHNWQTIANLSQNGHRHFYLAVPSTNSWRGANRNRNGVGGGGGVGWGRVGVKKADWKTMKSH